MSSPVANVFESTLAEFKARLTFREQKEFEFATLKDVQIKILEIQEVQEMRKTMMHMSRIQAFLEAMNEFSKVIEVFLNVSNFVAFIWGPMKFMLQVASTWADSFDTLLDAYKQIGESIPLLLQYADLFRDNKSLQNILGFIYVDILEFHKRALRFFSGRAWRQLFRSVWKDFKTRFHGILQDLRRHGDLLSNQTALLHMQQYQDDRRVILDQLERQEKFEHDTKFDKCLERICAPEMKEDHAYLQSIRHEHPGSTDWILQCDKVYSWKGTDCPPYSVLWLNGIPGAGKTVLASAIIDSCKGDASFVTSHFYCKEVDTERNTCISIFKGLLAQMLTQFRSLVPYCYDKLQSSGELVLTSTEVAKQLLRVFCDDIPKQFIIIDGLDECAPRERLLLLSFWTEIVDHCNLYEPGKVRILIVSQDFSDIRSTLSSSSILSMEPKDNAREIESFVHRWGRRLEHKYNLSQIERTSVEVRTCFRARGMFLFAKLVMENLHAQLTRADFLNEVIESRFPKELSDAYERIMSRLKRGMSAAHWEVAQKLLGWMVCAKRPLKWNEMQCAFSTDLDEQTINFNERKLRIHIRDLCGSLVRVLSGDRLELVHSTTKEHITQTGYIHKPSVECHMTSLCLRYLTFPCFGKDVQDDNLHDFALQGYFCLQDYAMAKWFVHIKAVVDSAKDLLPGDFVEREELNSLWISLDDFFTAFDDELGAEEPLQSVRESCKTFQNTPIYDHLVFILSHVQRHEEKSFEARNEVGITALRTALIRNRRVTEDMASGTLSAPLDVISSYYGERLFKCPKTTCFYFHEGFKDAKTCIEHKNRHDRPFNCDVPDCAGSQLGLLSNKDLAKHMRFYHPEVGDQFNMFSLPAKKTIDSGHSCRECGKRFTRKFALANHELSHKGLRPYACSECGKAFTRSNDCKRHEKIHARR